MQKSGAWWDAPIKPNPGNKKRGRSQGFSGWTAQTPWQALDQWETNLKVKHKKEGVQCLRMTPRLISALCMHAHIHVCTHTLKRSGKLCRPIRGLGHVGLMTLHSPAASPRCSLEADACTTYPEPLGNGWIMFNELCSKAFQKDFLASN